MKKLLNFLLILMLIITLVPVNAEEMDVYFTYYGTLSENDEYEYEHQTSAKAILWRNDCANLVIEIDTDGQGEVNVSDGLLKNENGDELQLYLSEIKSIKASLGTGEMVSEYPHMDAYDIVSDKMKFGIDQKGYVLVNIVTDEDTPDGEYKGNITIDVDGSTAILSLEVIVLGLTVKDEYSLDLWQYPFSSLYYYDHLDEPFSESHLEALKEEIKVYADAGGETITTTITDEPWSHQTYYDTPSMVIWYLNDDQSLWFDYSYFDTYVNLCMEMGVDGRISCFSILPFDNVILLHKYDGSSVKLNLEVESEEWKYYWTQFLYSFSDHLRQNGWLDKTYIFMDERASDHFKAVYDLIGEVCGDDRIKLAAAVNTIDKSGAYDVLDSVSVSIGAIMDDSIDGFIADRKEKGLETTLYNCSTNYPNAFAISNPDESLWTMWYIASKDFDGYLRWAYDAWMDGLNETFDFRNFEAGDTLLIYPDSKESTTYIPKASMRLLMIRQGLKQISKADYLSKDPMIAKMLEKDLNKLERAYGHYNEYGAFTGTDEASSTISSEVIRMEKALNKASMRYIRNMISVK